MNKSFFPSSSLYKSYLVGWPGPEWAYQSVVSKWETVRLALFPWAVLEKRGGGPGAQAAVSSVLVGCHERHRGHCPWTEPAPPLTAASALCVMVGADECLLDEWPKNLTSPPKRNGDM